MTEQELDRLLRKILLDAVALDEEEQTREEIPFSPSARHRRQIRAMLSNPLRWARQRAVPVWKQVLRRVAIILLILSISFAGMLIASPTLRASMLQWITEWGGDSISFRYTEEMEALVLPDFQIGELPEGYAENMERSSLGPTSVIRIYENADGGLISLSYFYMRHGTLSSFSTEHFTVIPTTVFGFDGYFFLADEPDKKLNTLVWFDTELDIMFTIDAMLGMEDIVHMAESIFLANPTI